jgi:hypothetical protein
MVQKFTRESSKQDSRNTTKKKLEDARLIPEQDHFICGSICVCQMVLLLSCAAMIYLAVIVFAPAHRAFNSDVEKRPVMCVTTRVVQHERCNRTTCCEWCLSKVR